MARDRYPGAPRHVGLARTGSGSGLAPFFSSCPLCGHSEGQHLVEFPDLIFDRCTHCSLIYKSAQRDGLEQGYQDQYFVHGRARYLRRWSHRVRKCRRQLLGALEYAPAARRVLDAGCSAGYLLEAARQLGLEAVGLDLSSFVARFCSQRGQRVTLGRLEELPFASGSFDIVTAKHTLEHCRNPLSALTEIRRVLTPGGVALIVVPDASYWKRYLLPRRGSYFRPDRAGWQHHVYFDDRTLAQTCLRAQLEPAHSGKAIHRRRLCHGMAALREVVRFGLLWSWDQGARLLHARREILLVARRPAEPTAGRHTA